MIVAADAAAFQSPQSELQRLRLFDALVEATENSRQHAYPEEGVYEHEHVGRWWMTGAVDAKNKQIAIVVYDQGVSIPGSIHRWAGYGRVKRGLMWVFGQEPSPNDNAFDGARLHLAMSKQESSTGQSERGHGLQVVRRVIDECARGRLRIVSRAGEYVYETGKKPVARQLAVPLPGTLLEWNLWL
jgi:hypothetical protein